MDILEGSFLAAHDPVAGTEVWIDCIQVLLLEDSLIKARRQRIDQIDVAGELMVFFARYAARYKDSQMAGFLVNRIDDRLAIGADFIDVVIQIENPAQCLLGRRDVVALRAKY